MDKSWDIIVWTPENSIDYVPSSWGNFERTQFKYPKNCSSTKIRKMIDSCLEPENFTWLDAVCKATSVKDLAMAKEMCDKGQYTSNLESSENDGPHKRRRKRKKLLYESSESSSDDTSSKSSSPLQVSQESQAGSTKRYTAKANKKGNLLGIKREAFTTPSSKNDSPAIAVAVNAHDPAHDQINNNIIHENPSNRFQRSNDENLTPKNGIQPKSSQARPRSLLGNSSKGAQSEPSTPKPNELSKVLEEIQFHMAENTKILKRLDAFMNTKENFNNADNLVGNELIYAEKLPCKTQGELEDINSFITNGRQNFKELVNYLYLLGGSTAHKAVYTMMSKIFDKKLALQYSGQGKKKKLPFCSLKIYEAIIASTRKRHPTESEDGIKKSVALFLATAKSRLGKEPNVTNVNEPQDSEGQEEEEDF
ncbi:unnamed protein product [Ceutorhynchus assimilis]|uniref:DUF4806 domain-containing protein n=1 Tax=Ceutorhynchus assimilis TaxID=467358 RepID=A0A9N9QNP4_9CUCU|nr:unnamed protein product [Ceutorhynchus assimilis]